MCYQTDVYQIFYVKKEESTNLFFKYFTAKKSPLNKFVNNHDEILINYFSRDLTRKVI